MVLPVDPLRQVATVSDGKEGIHEEAGIQAGAGPDGAGWFGTPMPGWSARVSNDMGVAAISAMMPNPTLYNDGPDMDHYAGELNTFLSLTGTPKIYRQIEGSQRNFRSHRPSDLIAGDQGFRTPEGAVVGALRGGVALLKASDLAQVIVNQVDDLLRLIGRNTDMITDWGNIHFINEEGRTKMVVRGNADASLTHQDTFAYEMIVGDGDSFIDMRLFKEGEEGKTVAHSLKMDRKGNKATFQTKDQSDWVGGHAVKTIIKDELRVVKGKQEVDIDVSQTVTCPVIHLGGEPTKNGTNQPAMMGNDTVAYLKTLVFWLNNMASFMGMNGVPTKPGAMFPAPEVPDLLSRVVDLTKVPNAPDEEP